MEKISDSIFVFDKTEVEDIPKNESGVYIMTNPQKEILYIGKAKDLKNRMKMHFNGKGNTKEYYTNFHKVILIYISTRHCDYVEKGLILKMNPKYNKHRLRQFHYLGNEKKTVDLHGFLSNYFRGRETFNDVIPLCEDCHKKFHGI